jgi:formate dehydrogenase subunit gamma
MGKFHPGQKLNAAFTAGAIAVMFLSGSIMHWFRFFPVDWRTGSTFVHDWVALLVFVAVTIHVTKALSEPVALQAMVRGWVPAAWARRHRPRWWEEAEPSARPREG